PYTTLFRSLHGVRVGIRAERVEHIDRDVRCLERFARAVDEARATQARVGDEQRAREADVAGDRSQVGNRAGAVSDEHAYSGSSSAGSGSQCDAMRPTT